MRRTINASDRPVETVAVADQRLISPDHLYVGGILPAELVDEMEVVRRGACMTLDEVAANIGISPLRTSGHSNMADRSRVSRSYGAP